jgi:DNA-binding GntR family transcriptional regulator
MDQTGKDELTDTLTLGQRIAHRLRSQILEGVLEAGTPLRQNLLAEQLGVSNNPVREALRLLEAEGFVSIHPYRGAVVRSLLPIEIVEISEILIALETRALRLAMPNITEDILKKAEEIDEQIRRETDIHRQPQLNFEFHSILYAPGGIPRLISMIHTYHQLGRYYALAYLRVPASYQKAPAPTHQDILAAIRKNDFREAEALLEEHNAYAAKALSSYIAQLQKDKEGPPLEIRRIPEPH